MRERVDEVIAERDRVTDRIAALGLDVVESQANFVWLPLGEHSAVLGEYCERAGVVLRPFPGVGVRITIGARAENDRLVARAGRGGRRRRGRLSRTPLGSPGGAGTA